MLEWQWFEYELGELDQNIIDVFYKMSITSYRLAPSQKKTFLFPKFSIYNFNTHHGFLPTYFMKYSIALYVILTFVYFMQLYFSILFVISILYIYMFVILIWDAGKICNIDSKMSFCVIFDCIFYQQNNIELL